MALPWEKAREEKLGRSVTNVPWVVSLEAWLRDYPGLGLRDLTQMDWQEYLELRAVRRGRAHAAAERARLMREEA